MLLLRLDTVVKDKNILKNKDKISTKGPEINISIIIVKYGIKINPIDLLMTKITHIKKHRDHFSINMSISVAVINFN